MKFLHLINYNDKGMYLSVGNKAPWLNKTQIKLNKLTLKVAKLFVNYEIKTT